MLTTEQLLTGPVAARAALVAAIASTAFVVFLYPLSEQAGHGASSGGHFIALLIASGLAAVAGTQVGTRWISDVPTLFAVYAALGVGASMLAMAATNTEHPPAAGTALGVVAHGFDWDLIVFVTSAVVILSLAHRVLRSRMTNL